MGSPGVGGKISSASDTSINNPTNGDLFVQNSSGFWANVPMIGQVALANKGGMESVSTNYTATGSVTLDLATGNVFRITLTGNTTLTFTGSTNNKACAFTLYVKQDGTGGRTLAWPSGVLWPGGTPAAVTSAANAFDVFVFETITGGTNWFGSLVGNNYS